MMFVVGAPPPAGALHVSVTVLLLTSAASVPGAAARLRLAPCRMRDAPGSRGLGSDMPNQQPRCRFGAHEANRFAGPSVRAAVRDGAVGV
jgi:hypothetical protein